MWVWLAWTLVSPKGDQASTHFEVPNEGMKIKNCRGLKTVLKAENHAAKMAKCGCQRVVGLDQLSRLPNYT